MSPISALLMPGVINLASNQITIYCYLFIHRTQCSIGVITPQILFYPQEMILILKTQLYHSLYMSLCYSKW